MYHRKRRESCRGGSRCESACATRDNERDDPAEPRQGCSNEQPAHEPKPFEPRRRPAPSGANRVVDRETALRATAGLVESSELIVTLRATKVGYGCCATAHGAVRPMFAQVPRRSSPADLMAGASLSSQRMSIDRSGLRSASKQLECLFRFCDHVARRRKRWRRCERTGNARLRADHLRRDLRREEDHRQAGARMGSATYEPETVEPLETVVRPLVEHLAQ